MFVMQLRKYMSCIKRNKIIQSKYFLVFVKCYAVIIILFNKIIKLIGI